MIRLMQNKDIDKIMDIWITATIPSHRFIDQSFWLKKYRKLKQKMADTTTYVICEQEQIVGFVTIRNQEILALSIISGKQGKGFGSSLLRHLQNEYDELHAGVYVKNEKAQHFFKKHGFHINERQNNADSHQMQNLIRWQKK